ncbi:DUF4307 domain-containing protein [Streptomyces sp. TRM 70351]|uniref:DUF4307 domain-containing protein n=1 Tax=Streptomyces sp. TRM 70351 TaxID=3116552 RepID=UPI002E7AF7B3|nr:DUF4307 domain-containing protein [Streptomyces sp. TRM 70351]MEE1927830.1 DUF4307 domain-containing protein [Streptomyces sp. TRM 70351]
MADQQQRPPAGRYGRSGRDDDARTDRQLKIVGAVLGTGFLALLGWFGYSYVTEAGAVSAEVIKSETVSDSEVRAHLEVRKDAGLTGVCSVRALAVDKAEVGRADYTFAGGERRVDRVVTLRTTDRAYATELVGCRPLRD